MSGTLTGFPMVADWRIEGREMRRRRGRKCIYEEFFGKIVTRYHFSMSTKKC